MTEVALCIGSFSLGVAITSLFYQILVISPWKDATSKWQSNAETWKSLYLKERSK